MQIPSPSAGNVPVFETSGAEVPVAKSPLYALNCSIPHSARGHMLRFSSPEAVFATDDSVTKILGSDRGGRFTSSAPGADFGLWRTAIDDSTHKTPLHVRLSGEIQAKSNSGLPTQTRNKAGHFEITSFGNCRWCCKLHSQ